MTTYSPEAIETILDKLLIESSTFLGSGALNLATVNNLDLLISKSKTHKGVITVILTSAVYKYLYPDQDIRIHQSGMEEGYSGRRFDTKYITPFLLKHRMPCAMAESGWLTRSLEQKVPYSMEYTGSITPTEVKSAFLNTIETIQYSDESIITDMIRYIFKGLISIRQANIITYEKSVHEGISPDRVELMIKEHLRLSTEQGTSRLPVLAVWAVCFVLGKEIKRYSTAHLLKLGSHTSADLRSKSLGDIDFMKNDLPFESYEIKYGKKPDLVMLENILRKIRGTSVERYYLLSTIGISEEDDESLKAFITKVKAETGCLIIIDDLIEMLRRYLRLISNLDEFIDAYSSLVANDDSLQLTHKLIWGTIREDSIL